MHRSDSNRAAHIYGWAIIALAILWLMGPLAPLSRVAAAQNEPFFRLTGVLSVGELIVPSYPQFGSPRAINFAFTIAGESTVALAVVDGGGSPLWSGAAVGGETLWGTVTLSEGFNEFRVTNIGAAQAEFRLELYDLPAAPYSWSGLAAVGGLHSQARLSVPVSGLYQFDFQVTAGQRYQFRVDGDRIAKAIDQASSAAFYLEAGQHELTIAQVGSTGPIAWQVQITAAGLASDALPYTKEGSGFDIERLPIFLGEPLQANLRLTATGPPGAELLLEVLPGADPVGSRAAAASLTTTILAGETAWVTFDLPAGRSLLQLSAQGAVSYALAVDAVPTAPYTWGGRSAAAGAQSRARVVFPQAGLYRFDFDVSDGPYQFLLQVDGRSHLRKTIAAPAEATFFVPAGTHDVTLMQSTVAGAEWDVAVALEAASVDLLPYQQQGSSLGGAGSAFQEEWLPLSLNEALVANLSIVAAGTISDSVRIELYRDGSLSADFTLPLVLGTEKLWAHIALSAGINRLRLVADGSNSQPMGYTLVLDEVGAVGDGPWDGTSLGDGLHSTLQLHFPSSGLYRFQIENGQGFANLILDPPVARPTVLAGPDDPARRLLPSGAALTTSYDRLVAAGTHTLRIVQDSAYPLTDWSASVTPVLAGAGFFHFTGTLPAGKSVVPEYQVDGAARAFNFALTAAGASVTLALENGGGESIWSGTILAGETVWGTGNLTGTNRLQLSNGGSQAAEVELTLYDLAPAPYRWSGVAAATGVHSHIQLDFPSDGLYTFALGVASGRYQLALDQAYLQKTVESTTVITAFVSAGIHDLVLIQDDGQGAAWEIEVAPADADADTLPDTRSGGLLGGAGNGFSTEWLPVRLLQPAAVNLELQLQGELTDHAVLHFFSAAAGEILTATVYGGETRWATLDLPVGVSRVRLTAADGNLQPLAYTLTLRPVASPDYTWRGTAAPMGQNSHIRLDVAISGLYRFRFSGSGRYQLLVDRDYIQKTIEEEMAVVYYLPQGSHDLWVDQDTRVGAVWQIEISGPLDNYESLPTVRRGGTLGGVDNDFTTEWLPMRLPAQTTANLVITVTGTVSDLLELTLWETAQDPVQTLRVHGGETVWLVTDLAPALRMRLQAGAHAGPLAYILAVEPIPTAPHTWHGSSLATGTHSVFGLEVELDGIYRVAAAMPEGFTRIKVNQPGPSRRSNAPHSSGFSYQYDIPLTGGLHTLVSEQSADFLRSTWAVTVSLVAADAPQVSGIEPSRMRVESGGILTVTGHNFMPTATVALATAAESYPLAAVTVKSTSMLSAVLPSAVPAGLYSVVVTNSDGRTGTLADSLTVLSAPHIDSVLPDRGKVGTGPLITVAGDGFLPGAALSLVRSGSRLALTDVTFLGPSTLTGVVPTDAPLGLYDLVATNPDDQEALLEQAYRVESNPLITAVLPPTTTVQSAAVISVTGSGFLAGAEVALQTGESTFPLAEVMYVSADQLRATVPATMPVGVYTVTVVNPDGVTADLVTGFTVEKLPPPQVEAVLPTAVPAGSTTSILVTGRHFQVGAAMHLDQGGTIYPLTDVLLLAEDRLSATVSADVPPGSYDLVVVNPDQQQALLAGALLVYRVAEMLLPVVMK